jgi:hypothetical protein
MLKTIEMMFESDHLIVRERSESNQEKPWRRRVVGEYHSQARVHEQKEDQATLKRLLAEL